MRDDTAYEESNVVNKSFSYIVHATLHSTMELFSNLLMNPSSSEPEVILSDMLAFLSRSSHKTRFSNAAVRLLK